VWDCRQTSAWVPLSVRAGDIVEPGFDDFEETEPLQDEGYTYA